MKKLLGISVIAMLAVSPMMANAAANGSVADVDITTSATADSARVASAQYVKEAYHAMAEDINEELAAKQNTIDATHKLSVDLVDGAATSTALTTGLAGKQDTIDSTHKLSVDLVEGAATSTALTTGLAGKQDNLSSDQMNAVNSGITAEKVSQFETAAGIAANAATREGVVSTINHSTASTGITLYSGWNSGNAPTPNAQPTNFSGTVTSPATNAYYGTVAAQSGTTQPEQGA